MTHHIVLFQLRDDLSEEERHGAMEKFRSQILALPRKLSIIRSLEVGFNINPAEQWDICLNSSFDTLDDVRTYSAFPDHQAAAAGLKPFLSGRSCVDYED